MKVCGAVTVFFSPGVAGLLVGALVLVGCRSSRRLDPPLVPQPMPGETIVQDGSHTGGMLLYDGHFVGGLKGRDGVEQAVDSLTPPGTFSVLVNDSRKRVFNVDSIDRLDFYLAEIEHIQGPLPKDVSFTVRSPKGIEGTVKGKNGLRGFLETRLAETNAPPGKTP